MQLTWLGASLFMIFVDLLDIPPHDLYICNGFLEFSEGRMSVTSVTVRNWRILRREDEEIIDCQLGFVASNSNTPLLNDDSHVVAINQHPTVFFMSQTYQIHHISAWHHPRTSTFSSLFLNDFSQEKVSLPQSSISYVFKLQFLASKRMPTDIHDVRSVNNWTFFGRACWKSFFHREWKWNVLTFAFNSWMKSDCNLKAYAAELAQKLCPIGQSWHSVYCHPDTNCFFFPFHSLR